MRLKLLLVTFILIFTVVSCQQPDSLFEPTHDEIPININAESTTRIELYWNNVPNTSGYNIYRRYALYTWVKLNDYLVKDNFYMDMDVVKNITYKYKITSVRDNVESGYSTIVTITFE